MGAITLRTSPPFASAPDGEEAREHASNAAGMIRGRGNAARWEPEPIDQSSVTDERFEVIDPSRDRTIPCRVFIRADSMRSPVVVLSHGMGENRDTSDWLAAQWAARGYWVVTLTHYGSDKSVLEQHGIRGIIAATREPETWRNRPLDVSFILDRIEAGEPLVPFVERAELLSVAIAGHSAGAFTAAALAGIPHQKVGKLRDARVSAIVAMSMPRLSKVIADELWSGIDVPALHVTGTLDFSPQYLTLPRHRRIPFDNARRRGDQYLVTLGGATHSTYSLPMKGEGRRTRLQRRIAAITGLFLDGWLKHDREAIERLEQLPSLSGVRLERK